MPTNLEGALSAFPAETFNEAVSSRYVKHVIVRPKGRIMELHSLIYVLVHVYSMWRSESKNYELNLFSFFGKGLNLGFGSELAAEFTDKLKV